MRHSIFFGLVCAAALVFSTISCDDGSDENTQMVYVVGDSYRLATDEATGRESLFASATAWNNGSLNKNLVQGDNNNGRTRKIFLEDNNVYVAGGIGDHWNSKPALWKNGALQSLQGAENGGEASGIFVSNGDVYLVGNNENSAPRAFFWKNGIMQQQVESAVFKDILVYDGTVYIAGHKMMTDENGINMERPVLWINGEERILRDAGKDATGTAVAIAVDNDRLYIAGTITTAGSSSAIYWGIDIFNDYKTVTYGLRYGDFSKSEATDICVSENTMSKNNDIYIVGAMQGNFQMATIWKNSSPTLLSSGKYGNAYGVYVHKGDVYVAGCDSYYNSDKEPYILQRAVLWKNNVPQALSPDISSAFDIAIKN